MNTPRMPVALLAAVMALLLLAGGTALARDIRKTLHFERGASGASVSGSVVRGDRDVFSLAAKVGQTMDVSINAREDNAVFTLRGPDGKYLPGAGDGEDATRFKGVLPLSGTYLVEVGGTRGNAEYNLTVTIR